MGKNLKLNLVDEYDFIKTVMKSCKTEDQMKVTRRMFENFKNKWKNHLDCFDMLELMYKFESDFGKIKNTI
jgi:hypothetical protein